ncbi:dihydroflavonol 4-reductase [Actinidia rufa]|uniref:Dihydroflavonol 4-reductase n=1 Tax=Actinidia rufa TaxID=165716 RepID=A0A7J0E1T9_9ERIC|nr:dihydroflavonol 4-reductase [Actinidia rufa]
MKDAAAAAPDTVCITGAAGFIGSWLAMRLLERGYIVRATVRDPGNMKKVKHLLDLPKAETNLTLWKADLGEEGSFDEAIQGCSGVFHVATPMDFESKDPENEVIKPTINGVLSIIRSCTKAKTVKRLVFTSSAGTVNAQEHQQPRYDENNWSDLDFIYAKKMTGWVRNEPHYSIIKQGQFVHLDDLCESHIFLYENPKAEGRYICSSHDATIFDLAKMMREKWPEYNVPSEFKGFDENLPTVSFSSEKLIGMGFKFKYSLEDMFRGAIDTCREKGLLPYSKETPPNGNANGKV